MLYIPIYLIFIPIISALIVYLFKNEHINYLTLVAQFAMSVLAITYFFYYRGDFSQTMFVFGGWEARIGISLSNDPLSMTFIFLTIFAWWMVLLYVFDFKHTHHNFLFFLMFLQGVFLGLIQTNDLFNMFVFLELTTIIVTILIAFKKAGDSFRAGIYYLLINTSGVLAFLVGLIIIYYTFGTINIYEIQAMMPQLGDRGAVRLAYVLLMAGVSVKAAFFPVFTWLPKAHGAAQSAISALLSGLIVKGGIYLFIRVNTMFAPANLDVNHVFFAIGAASAIVGAIFALSQNSIKQLLAYSTVSQIGVILMALSFDPTGFANGGVFHLVNHAIAKMALFFGAGMIIKVYKTKKLDELHGVFKAMPVISTSMIIAMLSLSGLPFLSGYASKSVIKYQLEAGSLAYTIFYISNVLTPIILLRLGRIFIGPKVLSFTLKQPLQVLVMGLLGSSLVVLGLFFGPIFNGLWAEPFTQVSFFSLTSWLDYLSVILIAFLSFYFLIFHEKRVVRNIRHFSVSFETANVVFVAYIVFLATIYFIL